MKRLLYFFILLMLSPTVWAFAKPQRPTSNRVAKQTYEEVYLVEALSYDDITETFYNGGRLLYKGVNTDDKFYFKDLQGRYYPLKKNTLKTYNGRNVTTYEWVIEYKNTKEFTNMVRIEGPWS